MFKAGSECSLHGVQPVFDWKLRTERSQQRCEQHLLWNRLSRQWRAQVRNQQSMCDGRRCVRRSFRPKLRRCGLSGHDSSLRDSRRNLRPRRDLPCAGRRVVRRIQLFRRCLSQHLHSGHECRMHLGLLLLRRNQLSAPKGRWYKLQRCRRMPKRKLRGQCHWERQHLLCHQLSCEWLAQVRNQQSMCDGRRCVRRSFRPELRRCSLSAHNAAVPDAGCNLRPHWHV